MSARTSATGLALLIASSMGALVAAADDATAPDPKQVCIAAVEQGQTQRDDGKYRAARASFLACAQDTCPKVIQQSCTKWLRELDESAPTIVLAAKDTQGNDLTDVTVTFDEQPFATQLDGKPQEVDVGEHVIHFERQGDVPVDQKVLLSAGERARLISVTLHAVDESPADGGVDGEAPGAPESAGAARPAVVATVGIAAVAAAATGVYFILHAGHEQSVADGLRGTLGGSTACSNPAGSVAASCQSLHDAAYDQRNSTGIATGMFIGAGVLAAGAVASWFLWPKGSGEPPQTTGTLMPLPGGGGLLVSGSF